MVSMERIDFKAITEKVVTELRNIPLEERIGMRYKAEMIKIHHSDKSIESMLVSRVWEKSLELLNRQVGEDGPLSAEKALSILVRKGVLTDKVQFRKDSFRISLKHSQYRIYKQFATGIHACPWPSEKLYRTLASGEDLADFIMSFDEEVPAILSHAPGIMSAIKERELEEIKRLMEEKIKREIIQNLIDQYLTPLGLSVRFGGFSGDIVSLNISKTLSAHLEIPFEQLADKLKDSAGIQALLKEDIADKTPRRLNPDPSMGNCYWESLQDFHSNYTLNPEQ